MVLETIQQSGERHGVITRVAEQLGIGAESLRGTVRTRLARSEGVTRVNQCFDEIDHTALLGRVRRRVGTSASLPW
jgi:hypothetical protein